MRYVHSLGFIHRDLNPNHVWLDWDWHPTVGGFRYSLLSNSNPETNEPWPPGNPRYLAPECYENATVAASDVFSFGLLLYELIAGRPGIPTQENVHSIAHLLVAKKWRPKIPDFVVPPMVDLIGACWANDSLERPTFNDILLELEEIEYRVTATVNSARVAAFVRQITKLEGADLTSD
jgi:serine/threonine-protein kinase